MPSTPESMDCYVSVTVGDARPTDLTVADDAVLEPYGLGVDEAEVSRMDLEPPETSSASPVDDE